MKFSDINKLYGFYLNELKNNILGFWLPRCEDKDCGGFVIDVPGYEQPMEMFMVKGI